MTSRPMPRHVVITGASGGIGSALAREYATPGVRLTLTGRALDRLEAVASQCRNKGAEVVTVPLDVRARDAVARALTDANAAAPIDLVIANAGVSSGMTPDGRPEDWASAQRTLDINLGGTLNTVQAAADIMRPHKQGQIAVIGSLAAWYGLPSCPAYSASKAAIEAYAGGLRGMLRRDGIAVNVVSPGYVVSPMSERLLGFKPFLMTADKAARLIRRGLERDKARIFFPLPLALGTRLLTVMPGWLADRVLPLFAFKVQAEDGARD